MRATAALQHQENAHLALQRGDQLRQLAVVSGNTSGVQDSLNLISGRGSLTAQHQQQVSSQVTHRVSSESRTADHPSHIISGMRRDALTAAPCHRGHRVERAEMQRKCDAARGENGRVPVEVRAKGHLSRVGESFVFEPHVLLPGNVAPKCCTNTPKCLVGQNGNLLFPRGMTPAFSEMSNKAIHCGGI